MTEEIYQNLGNNKTIAETSWPTYDEAKTIENVIQIPVQVNGKLRSTIKITLDSPENEIKELVHANTQVQNSLDGKTIVKEIYVKNKIYNIVVK